MIVSVLFLFLITLIFISRYVYLNEIKSLSIKKPEYMYSGTIAADSSLKRIDKLGTMEQRINRTQFWTVYLFTIFSMILYQ
jgi:hypothetical protein